MIPIYWINLDESVHRRNIMISQCKQHKLKNRRIVAIKHERPTIGCCLSHIKAIHTAWLEENEMALICEDDVNFIKGKDLMRNIQLILDSMPEDIKSSWDIIQLQYTEPVFTDLLNNYLESNSYKVKNKLIEGYFMGAVAYLINWRGMNKFLNTMTKIHAVDFEKYEVTANFDHPKAISEELIYRYVNTYISIFPVFSYLDNKSTINDNPNYYIINKVNKLHIDRVIDSLNQDNYKISQNKTYKLDYNTHWFDGDKEKAANCLTDIFKD